MEREKGADAISSSRRKVKWSERMCVMIGVRSSEGRWMEVFGRKTKI